MTGGRSFAKSSQRKNFSQRTFLPQFSGAGLVLDFALPKRITVLYNVPVSQNCFLECFVLAEGKY